MIIGQLIGGEKLELDHSTATGKPAASKARTVARLISPYRARMGVALEDFVATAGFEHDTA
jgi:hypothetical protein